MKKIVLVFSLVLVASLFSCKKGPGTGGKSQITGKIWIENYNTLNNIHDTYHLKDEYAGVDRNVYLIFGDDIGYGLKTKSGPDGIFQFNYLREGNYKVYVESKDTARTTISGSTSMEVNITLGKKENYDTGNIVIYN
jgi:hypothetical protein